MSDSFEFETRTVRPYAVTGGRVRSANTDLPLEALVEVRQLQQQVRAYKSGASCDQYHAVNIVNILTALKELLGITSE